MSDPIQIKKYPNRRLYHQGERRYVNLDDVERMVREDVDFRVVDAQTGGDLTNRVLAQVVLEQLKDYEPLLPAELLKLMIKHRGSVGGFPDVLRSFVATPPSWMDPLGLFTRGKAPAAAPSPGPTTPEKEDDLHDELETLRHRLEEIEGRLGRRGARGRS